MKLLDSIWNGSGLEWLARASLAEIVIILAAMAAHDNRIDFEDEGPWQPVPEGLLVEVAVVADK